MSALKAFREAVTPEDKIDDNTERIGIGGFTMYASLNETATKTATVTANPVESGSTINDHVIKNPTTISISGEVANIFIEKPSPTTIQELVPAVGIVQDYLPSRTQTQLSKITALAATVEDYLILADDALDKGAQLYDYFKGVDDDTNITDKFLDFFDRVFESGNFIDVQCIDKLFKKMVITSFTTTKQNPGDYSFTITLQNIVEAETRLLQLVKNASGDAKAQGAGLTDKGTQQAKPVDQSFASALLGSLS